MTEHLRPIRGDDDVSGHYLVQAGDAEVAEGEQDAEGYAANTGADEDDVVGHVQPPRDFGR